MPRGARRDAGGAPLDLLGRVRTFKVDARIARVLVAAGHLPERVFDDAGRVHAHAEFQKEHLPARVFGNERPVARAGGMPALVLDEGIVRAKVHGHRLSADGASGNEFGRDLHIFLPRQHLAHLFFVVVRLFVAGNTALEQPVIALRIKQPPFLEPRGLKPMVYVGGQNKIIFPLHEPQEGFVRLARGLVVSVDVDIPRPKRPKLFQRRVRVKPARIHIAKAVFFREIRKILIEPLPRIGEPRRRGKPRPRADDDRVRLGKPFLHHFHVFFHDRTPIVTKSITTRVYHFFAVKSRITTNIF